jgi:ankyrin repeat protein
VSWFKFLLVGIGGLLLIAVAFISMAGGLPSLRMPMLRRDLSPAQRALFSAVRTGDLVGVRDSLAQGADVESIEFPRRRTPLMIAAASNQPAAAKALLAAHADVRATDRAGWIPLCIAADAGAADVAVLLLEAGGRSAIDTTCVVTGHRRTPLAIAVRRGHASVVTMLLAAHADVRSVDAGDLTPLEVAVQAGRLDLASLLVHAGAPLGISPGAHSASLLHLALEYCHDNDPDMVKLLIAAGADTTTRDALGNTPLQSARTAGQRHLNEGCFGRIADALREAGVAR